MGMSSPLLSSSSAGRSWDLLYVDSYKVARRKALVAACVPRRDYSISHDLLASLRHISGFSKILMEEFAPSLPPEAQRHLQRIEQDTTRMGQLVDDLLNLTRVGRREVNLQVTGLEPLVQEIIAGRADTAHGRRLFG